MSWGYSKKKEQAYPKTQPKKNLTHVVGSATPTTGKQHLSKSSNKDLTKIYSWVDAEKLGLKIDDIPLDSIIQGSGKNAKIVGYEGGSTFSSKGLDMISPDMKDFVTYHNDYPDEKLKIRAINSSIAKRIAKEHWTDSDFRLFEYKQKMIEVR